MKKNYKPIKTLIILVLMGLFYLVFVRITGICFHCPFQKMTGWLCPGCGITTMFYRISKFNFHGAYNSNPYIFVTLPILVFFILYDIYLKVNLKKTPKWLNVLMSLYAVGLIAFMLFRNIYYHKEFHLFFIKP